MNESEVYEWGKGNLPQMLFVASRLLLEAANESMQNEGLRKEESPWEPAMSKAGNSWSKRTLERKRNTARIMTLKSLYNKYASVFRGLEVGEVYEARSSAYRIVSKGAGEVTFVATNKAKGTSELLRSDSERGTFVEVEEESQKENKENEVTE